ncbi:chorismate mutase [Metallumcola ferriviriculae]|uniref:chorismate mutase n=1 Tax=Metallumcola ferriviriculae TaxID=3039180 RepID=A0AAU0UNU7_9FIRM|nr:chorismate mutase [Desulfitibacteraceae bacterium MK1]
MAVRGIRGATSVAENNPQLIKEATGELLRRMVDENQVDLAETASIFFTVTRDLDAAFPAAAARELGWTQVPLLCATEINVPGSVLGIIRVLIHVNTDKKQHEIKHSYLKDAVKLREDLR